MRIRFLYAILLWSVPAFPQPALVPAPGLTYSAYLRSSFAPAAVTTDSSGNVYLAGSTIVDTATRQTAAMVVKLNPKGTEYLYVRTFGGSLSDIASAIAVDSAGDAYITGTATSSDFPVTGRQFASAPSSAATSRTFLIKLDPQGNVLFSELLGASSYNFGQAVALTSQGDILVSGMAAPGFPATSGAYAATGTATRPYLMRLDPTGATIRFAAFGIGGNALAIDAAGNIYMAGATTQLDYPTTPGVYQPVFHQVINCYFLCQIGFPGTNQYLTKVDPTGSKLIYSTAVAGGGQTTNTGLAIDSAGNAYLTGIVAGSYPYTVQAPNTQQVRPFLTKIDPVAKNALYSILMGGAGVALDAAGHVLIGGSYNNINVQFPVFGPQPPPPPPVASVNAIPQCLLNNMTTLSQAYVSEVDATSGNVLATVLIDASNLTAAGISLLGDAVWIAGNTTLPDVPISAGAITDAGGQNPGFAPGAYLGMVDFTLAEPFGAPNVVCALDSAGGSRLGAVAPGQLLSLFGTNLGPVQGVAAPDSSTTSLAGVSVMFNGTPGTLLYVSESQINVAVPVASNGAAPALTSMEVAMNSLTSSPRQLPLVQMSPNLFVNVAPTNLSCSGTPVEIFAGNWLPLAQNQDGTMNSCDNPAKVGSVVSFFVDGLGGTVSASITFTPAYPGGIPMVVQMGNLSAEVVNIAVVNNFVWRVDVLVPPDVVNGLVTTAHVSMSLVFETGVVPVGPRAGGSIGNSIGAPLATMFWVSP